MIKTGLLMVKIFYNWRYNEEIRVKWPQGRKGRNTTQERSKPPWGLPSKGRIITVAALAFVPKEWQVEAPYQTLQRWSSCSRKKSPECLALQDRRAFSQETQTVCDRLCASRMHTKSHILREPRQTQRFERSLGQTRLLISEILPKRQGASGAHPGDTDTGSSVFFFFFWSPSTMRPLGLVSVILESFL